MAASLFFPNGRNREGALADYEVDLKDYQEVAVDDKIAVGQLYNDTNLPIIRFYLTTRKKKDNQSNSQDEVLSSPFFQDQVFFLSQPSSSALSVATTSHSTISETVTPDLIFVGSITNHENINFSPNSTELREEVLDSSNKKLSTK
ncbi:hypothetical protein XENOCAPTIV_029637 [Xenoophorus captivus]|uniref:Uncharacterized protein n=1 Tax=Xenoophorus captivus TaxID=1517983 RepID=A0ABV0QCD5_9TELE